MIGNGLCSPMSAGVTRWAAIAAAALVLTACDQGATSQTNQAGSAKPVEVRLGYFANITHAQALLGVDTGEFQKAIGPHTLKTKVFNAGPSLVEALFAGEIDLGYIGPGPALSAFEKSKGQGITVLAGAAANGVAIVARSDAGISTMADLAGKKIATPQMGNTQDIAARHYLLYELKQTNADNVVPVPNAEQSGMMSRGQIDAAWAPEPWAARLVAETGGTIITEEKDLWPQKQFVLTVVIARPEFAAQHPDIVENFLRAHIDLTARLNDAPMEHVEPLGKAMLTLTGKSMNSTVLADALGRVKFLDTPLPATFDTMATWAVDLGFSRAKPDVSKMINTTLLEKARARPAATVGATQ